MQPPPQRPNGQGSSIAGRLQEIRSADQLHLHLRNILQGNFLAPLASPAAIVDVGCGNGRWVMEVAAQFPSARVTGIDIMQPEPFVSLGRGLDRIPANASFVQSDILQGLPFPDGQFDFVHIRQMYEVIPAAAWGPLLQDVFRVTRPGGWAESLEPLPYAVQQGSALATFVGWLISGSQQRGVEPVAALKMQRWMEAAGFERVTRREFSPAGQAGASAEDVRKSHERSLALIDKMREPIVSAGIASDAQYRQVAAKARSELLGRPNMSDFNIYVHTGQKPPARP
jgi:SAM-dependent methyltransferase